METSFFTINITPYNAQVYNNGYQINDALQTEEAQSKKKNDLQTAKVQQESLHKFDKEYMLN